MQLLSNTSKSAGQMQPSVWLNAPLRIKDGKLGTLFSSLFLHLNGVDMIRWNEEGRIVEFTAMFGPLKTVNLIYWKMK